jgi:protein-S-isoprenylcysteine O-methyltransferase Ste14
MSRLKRTVVSVVLVLALLVAVCTVRPTPACASSSSETIAIAIGGTIGGLAIIAVIMTIIVRNNPAWLPAVPQADDALKASPWDRPPERVQFGLRCGVRDGVVPLVCW